MCLCTALGWQLRDVLRDTDVMMLFLAGAVIVAARLGRGAAFFYSFLSVSAFNFFFVEPVFTFNVGHPSYWLTFAVMLFACFIVSAQAAHLRDSAQDANMREQEAKRLYLELQELSENIRQSKIETETEKVRNTLLSAISHDLRTPLAAITGAADTLAQEEGATPLLTTIRQESLRLSRIVNNLLDITRMQDGRLKLNVQHYDPAEIIGSAVEAATPVLHRHPLTLHVQNNLPLVRMDGLLMSQVLQNLLENAAHHTPPDTRVTLTADMIAGGLRLTVEDNGAGILKGREEEIFNTFSTFSNSANRRGVGLGLSICRAILTAHEGTIRAENAPEGGCRIIVSLPAGLTVKDIPDGT